MPKILSFNGVDPKDLKQNPIKALWEWFQSQDKFVKSTVIVTAILVISTPIIVKTILTLNQHASNPTRRLVMGIAMKQGRDRGDGVQAEIDEIENFKNQVGQYPGSYSIWNKLNVSFPDQQLLTYLDSKGITPVIFMESDPHTDQEIADGAFDDFFKKWAQDAKNYGKRVILRYDQEMNAGWFPWGTGQFTASWQHIYNLVKGDRSENAIKSDNVEFFWCPWGLDSWAVGNMGNYFPGVDYVDYVGFDSYSGFDNRGHHSMEVIYGPAINKLNALAPGKPIIIGETGINAYAKEIDPAVFNDYRNNWIRDGYNYVYNNWPQIKAILYLNTNEAELHEAGRDWKLDTNPSITTAYAEIAAQAKFQGGFDSVPTPTITPTITPTPTAGIHETGTGSLRVNVSPAGAVNAGAQWQVDGGAFQNSAAIVSGLSVGDHTIAFSVVNGWTTPVSKTVTIRANRKTTTRGTYVAIPGPTGSLQVGIAPAGASAGRWKVDSGSFKTSGAIVSRLQVGTHTVTFKTITGWTTPENQIVTVNENQTTTVTGAYVAMPGSLQVNVSPAGAVNAGAQWQVDGGEFQNPGTVLSGLTAGGHTIVFKSVGGWTTPASKTVTIRANRTTTTTGTYKVMLGSLQVNINPAEASSLRAQWKVDDGSFKTSGAIVSRLQVGTHTVTFKPIDDWNVPENQIVTVNENQTTTVTGTYTLAGSESQISPVADTYVSKASKDDKKKNFGWSIYMKADADPATASYLKFDLRDFEGKTISRAILTLTVSSINYAGSGLKKGITVKSFTNDWDEYTLVYNNKPGFGSRIAPLFTGERYPGQTINIDVTSFIRKHPGQFVSMSLQNNGINGITVDTREALNGHPPVLTVRSR